MSPAPRAGHPHAFGLQGFAFWAVLLLVLAACSAVAGFIILRMQDVRWKMKMIHRTNAPFRPRGHRCAPFLSRPGRLTRLSSRNLSVQKHGLLFPPLRGRRGHNGINDPRYWMEYEDDDMEYGRVPTITWQSYSSGVSGAF